MNFLYMYIYKLYKMFVFIVYILEICIVFKNCLYLIIVCVFIELEILGLLNCDILSFFILFFV